MKIFSVALTLALAATLAQAQTPNHLYRLDGDLSDAMGGPSLVALGGTLDAGGYNFAANQGLEMPALLGGLYTIDLTFHFDSQGGWKKIIDFSALTSDVGMYRYDNGWNFYNQGLQNGTVAAGTEARLTLTRDSGGQVAVYGDGVLQFAFQDSSGTADFGGNTARFFVDDFATNQGEAAAGRVDYIRTYATALSAVEVGALGPVSAVPEPAGAALSLFGLAVLALRLRRRR